MQVTVEMVSIGLGLVGLVLTVWWRVEKRIRIAEQRSTEEAATARQAPADFRVEVASRYVSQERLREVEDRLVAAINRLADQMERMPDRLAHIVKETVGAK